MRRPGEVLSWRQILDQVWDFAYDGAPNVVDVYVGYPRRKIGSDLLEASGAAGRCASHDGVDTPRLDLNQHPLVGRPLPAAVGRTVVVLEVLRDLPAPNCA